MRKRLTNIITAIFITLFGLFLFTTKPVNATVDPCSDPNSAMYNAAGCGTANNIENVVGNIISAIIGILGIVAVVFIVIGGIQYMTSAGDSGKVKKAKDTILYACIGLAVAALAFAITQFAINAINNSTTTPCASGNYDPNGNCMP